MDIYSMPFGHLHLQSRPARSPFLPVTTTLAIDIGANSTYGGSDGRQINVTAPMATTMPSSIDHLGWDPPLTAHRLVYHRGAADGHFHPPIAPCMQNTLLAQSLTKLLNELGLYFAEHTICDEYKSRRQRRADEAVRFRARPTTRADARWDRRRARALGRILEWILPPCTALLKVVIATVIFTVIVTPWVARLAIHILAAISVIAIGSAYGILAGLCGFVAACVSMVASRTYHTCNHLFTSIAVIAWCPATSFTIYLLWFLAWLLQFTIAHADTIHSRVTRLCDAARLLYVAFDGRLNDTLDDAFHDAMDFTTSTPASNEPSPPQAQQPPPTRPIPKRARLPPYRLPWRPTFNVESW
jgi:hypothetical protein